MAINFRAISSVLSKIGTFGLITLPGVLYSNSASMQLAYGRWEQTKESAQMIASKNYIGKWFVGDYKKDVSEDLKDITIKMQDVHDFYDLPSSLRYTKGIELKKGVVLTSLEDNRFGEFSGMAIKKDANNNDVLEVITDRGNYLETVLQYDKEHTLQSFGNTKLGQIKGLSKGEEDVEDIAIYKNLDGTVDYIITHEKMEKGGKVLSGNKISVYKGGNFEDASSREVFEPESIKDLPKNEGLEAIAINPTTKKIFAIDEFVKKGNQADLHGIHIWNDLQFKEDVNVTPAQFYKSSAGYGISAMSFLNNGDMVVLERYSKQNMTKTAEEYAIKVKLVIAPNLNKKIIEGNTIIEIDSTSKIYNKFGLADNFEAMTITQHDDGNYSLFLMTDDNRAAFQNTVLLQFDIQKDIMKAFMHDPIEAHSDAHSDF